MSAATNAATDASTPSAGMGIVVIGRNEGERLRRCLESVSVRPLVYVDSGSSDGSPARARALGAEVVLLDAALPYTAARARNAGWQHLRERHPALQRVQFIDGDCELVDGWLRAGQKLLDRRADVAAVCGRLRERHPEHSVYNRLCDAEWNRPAGDTDACGGIALYRLDALDAVGGFRADLVAGEEPELCARLRAAGWAVHRLGDDMAWHDADMRRFGQWWLRAQRAGFAYANLAALPGYPARRVLRQRQRRTAVWAGALPLGVAAGAAALGPWALLGLGAYALQVWRLARGDGEPRARLERALFLVLGKFPELVGQLQYRWRAPRGAAPSFDYKSGAS